MAAANTVSDLQAVDFGLGAFLSPPMKVWPPAAQQLFSVSSAGIMPPKFSGPITKTDRTLLIRIAGKVSNGNALPDLPVIAYYRSPGLSGSDEKPRSYDLTRYSDEGTTKIKLTAVPVEISCYYRLLRLGQADA